jgi:DNA-binding response OmpR family regulator
MASRSAQIVGTLIAARAILASAELVILDLMLPDGSGFEVLHDRAAQPPRAAVIVLSSRDGEADRVAALETGADDYVTKPFSPREIVARVRAVLRRGRGPRPERARADQRPPCPSRSTSDPPRHRARQAIDLTRVEFDLLACLLAAPGRVFTRAQLIDRGLGRRLRHHRSHHRLAREGPAQEGLAEAGGDAWLIETVRGVGYRVRSAPPTAEGSRCSVIAPHRARRSFG